MTVFDWYYTKKLSFLHSAIFFSTPRAPILDVMMRLNLRFGVLCDDVFC